MPDEKGGLWQCPDCGAEMVICRYQDGTTKRECTKCDWDRQLPEVDDA